MLFGSQEAHDVEGSTLLRLLRRVLPITPRPEGRAFIVRRAHPVTGKVVLWVTPLFIALLMIAFADLIFAVDSIPAIFSITTDPFIVYTSNIFAVVGQRALFFALAVMAHRFHYLKDAPCHRPARLLSALRAPSHSRGQASSGRVSHFLIFRSFCARRMVFIEAAPLGRLPR